VTTRVLRPFHALNWAEMLFLNAARVIILHIQNPYVPSIDLVDMPGLVNAPQVRNKPNAPPKP
jgi:hypothetical protein